MKVKVLLAAIIGGTILSISGCGNKQLVDTHYVFKKAIIDGVGEVEVSSWNDYDDSDMVQIKTKDGVIYYTHSSKVILMSK
ncbi:MAG: hypothetical protein IKR19_07440 [Acholeplasmatales bacterium]|nr:hypothetical protein [Acholeplasmatales bacterium]